MSATAPTTWAVYKWGAMYQVMTEHDHSRLIDCQREAYQLIATGFPTEAAAMDYHAKKAEAAGRLPEQGD